MNDYQVVPIYSVADSRVLKGYSVQRKLDGVIRVAVEAGYYEIGKPYSAETALNLANTHRDDLNKGIKS